MIDLATLELRREKRPFILLDSGARKSEREFLDFIVNGVSLWQLCTQAGLDNISCLWLPHINYSAIKRLLLLEPADLPHNRCSLYVCAECGALDCGALSIRIEIVGHRVIWSDFAYQNDYDGWIPDSLEQFASINPVTFDLAEYRKWLLPLLSYGGGKV